MMTPLWDGFVGLSIALVCCVLFIGAGYLVFSWLEARDQERLARRKERRVFCKDCKHYKVSIESDGAKIEKCLVAREQVDPVEGVRYLPSYPRLKNAKLDCEDHTPHGAERVRRGSQRSV